MKKILRLFSLSIATLIGFTAFHTSTYAQNASEEECTKIYNEKFLVNRTKDQPQARKDAQEYLDKCKGKDEKIDAHLMTWIPKYNCFKPFVDFKVAVIKKDVAKAFTYGKHVLENSCEAGDFTLETTIKLAYMGFEAEKQNNKNYRIEAANYCKKAIEMIDAGKTPGDWMPFTGKDDALAYLYYTLGLTTKESDSEGAAIAFYKATTFESPIKKSIPTYVFLANLYNSEYLKVTNVINNKCPTGASATNECKALIREQEAWYDLLLDVSARIDCLSGKSQASRKPATQMLKEIFKNNYSFMEEAADEVIDCKSLLQKPLIDPATKLNTK